MEKIDYRDNLEAVLAFTGGRHLLNAKEVGAFLGIDYRTARKRYDFDKYGAISAPTLARQMCSARRGA